MGKEFLADVLELSIPERIQLVEDIWDSITTIPHAVPLSDAQREELDRRLEDYHQNPSQGAPWETIKSHILGQK
jgi:putative addiction module component (TIGR02574 family)